MNHRFKSKVLLRPNGFFRQTCSLAIRVRKQLRALHHKLQATGHSGSMDDALAIADLVEQLCRHGQQVDAEDAIDLQGYVELLVDKLLRRIDALLAS